MQQWKMCKFFVLLNSEELNILIVYIMPNYANFGCGEILIFVVYLYCRAKMVTMGRSGTHTVKFARLIVLSC